MGNCASTNYSRLLGTDIRNSSLAFADPSNPDLIDFMVPYFKPPHYSMYCNELVPALDPIDTINKYTDHTTELFARVNLALAADSPSLKSHGTYIKELRSSILSMPYDDNVGYLYRGVDLSLAELNRMETLRTFYIPSFTSTSLDSDKAYNKNTTMVVKMPYGADTMKNFLTSEVASTGAT